MMKTKLSDSLEGNEGIESNCNSLSIKKIYIKNYTVKVLIII